MKDYTTVYLSLSFYIFLHIVIITRNAILQYAQMYEKKKKTNKMQSKSEFSRVENSNQEMYCCKISWITITFIFLWLS